jgi:hypothetical protein
MAFMQLECSARFFNRSAEFGSDGISIDQLLSEVRLKEQRDPYADN